MVSFQGSAGILPGGTSLSESTLMFDGMPERNTTSSVNVKLDSMERLKEEVKKQLEKNNAANDVSLEIETRGLIIRFPDNVLFDPGSAEIKTGSLQALSAIGKVLDKKEYQTSQIRVEGHTDNVPMNSFRYPSNWELSTARATNVIKYMIANIGLDPDRLSASGYGEYQPIASNSDNAGRSKNRRVDIVVLSTIAAANEPQSTTGGN